MSDEVLIKVEGVRKKFCRSLKKSLWYGMKDMGAELVGGSRQHDLLRPEEFWAVNGVSFELRRGECLGLIGRNGAGKTTLLRMLNGLIKPDHGRIEMHGRVGALIALGTGFNPILTGRENIYVNGSVLGLTKKEIDEKIEDIIDFADIRDFIDAPVQSYSSGMQVRLGFAVATALEPDVLILDEVLAVGDAVFRNKCYRRISQLSKRASVIFVSHNIEQLSRICDHSLVLARGEVKHFGNVQEGIAIYEANLQGQDKEDGAFLSLHDPIVGFSMKFESVQIKMGAPVQASICVESLSRMEKFIFRITIYNASGGIAAECTVLPEQHKSVLPAGLSTWEVVLDTIPLKNGRYWVGANIFDEKGAILVWGYKQYAIEVIGGYLGANSDCQLSVKQWRSKANKIGPIMAGPPA